MWDPKQYAGIERLNMDAGTSDARIWTPDIQLLNTCVASTLLVVNKKLMICTVPMSNTNTNTIVGD